MTTTITPDSRWTRRRDEKQRRLGLVKKYADGAVLPSDKIVEALEALILPGDRVVLEGNNQKQADFLSRSLAKADPAKLHDLHMIMPSVGRSEHLDLFEKGIARKLDFSFAGTQSLRISQLLEDGLLEIGAIHTYIELYARLVVDLIPNVVLSAGFMADRAGNIYTGASTEDTPALIEPAAFSDGIVIVQVNQLVDDVTDLPRVDIPASWVDFVVVADKPFYIEPLFTRDPRHIKPVHVLMAMMAIRGIYEKHNVQSLNHGIGFNTAAIELILPTYGESLGLKGKICRNWTLNPHPTLIPAIESGWVESVHCFGTELGMENYIAARPDVFFTGRDGSMRSNRMFCQLAGQYAVDLFIGATLQVDGDGHSSTVTRGRLAGFGGAPNMGHDPRGRRHGTPAWLDMRHDDAPEALLERGKKTRGANGRDLPGRRQTDLRRNPRRGGRRAQKRHAPGADHDLRRRRHPPAHRRRHRLLVQGAFPGRAPSDDRRRCWCHRHRLAPQPQGHCAHAPRRLDRLARRPRYPPHRRHPRTVGRQERGRPGGVVRWLVQPARQVQELVNARPQTA